MTDRIKNIVVAVLCGLWVFGLSLWGIIEPDKDIIDSISRTHITTVSAALTSAAICAGAFQNAKSRQGIA